MPLLLQRGDITKVHADAIVNAANPALAPGGGVSGAIFCAAGIAELDTACRKVGGCEVGGAVATPAYALDARHVIHAVGPVWRGGDAGERELLSRTYRSALEVAKAEGDHSVAFPLISSGIYGYPFREALTVAEEAISAFLADIDDDMEVSLVLFPGTEATLRRQVPAELGRFLSERGLGTDGEAISRALGAPAPSADDTGAFAAPVPSTEDTGTLEEDLAPAPPLAASLPQAPPTAAPQERPGADTVGASRAKGRPRPQTRDRPRLRDLLGGSHDGDLARAAAPSPLEGESLVSRLARLDEGFSATLMALIDERGLKDSDVYRRANVSRQLFSKIRSNPAYRPSKPTVLAFCLALELSADESCSLLAHAGYALNPSSVADQIVGWFIERGDCSIMAVNEALYAYDQPLLGA